MNSKFCVGNIVTNDNNRSFVVVSVSTVQVVLAQYDSNKWHFSTINTQNPDFRVTGQIPVEYAREIWATVPEE